MRGQMPTRPQLVFPKPGKTLKGVLIVLFALWLMFAIGINWAGASEEVFLLLCGNNQRILDGQVWRLLTAPLVHLPSGTISHIVSAMLGLYFLSPSLEEAWGSKRFLRFLVMSALLAYGLQFGLSLVLPQGLSDKLVPPYWFGAIPVVEAIAIAWALSFKGRTVHLMFVLPVSSRGLIFFVIGISVLYLIAGSQTPGGMIAPFGGMLAGWLFGGGTPSPVRRFWLKLRLAQLDIEAKRDREARRRRARSSNLRLIDGGRSQGEDEEPGSGPHGRFLN